MRKAIWNWRLGLPLLLASAAAANALLAWRAGARARKERFVTVDGVRLHYSESGEGPVLVALHGNGALLQDFHLSEFVAQAGAAHRVIVFDRPGYGLSTRPAGRIWSARAQARLIAKALQQLGVEQATILGHSWGTLVALEMALAEPALVRHLVLLSGYYFPTPRPDILLMATPALPGLGTILRYTVEPLLVELFWDAMVKRLFAPAPVPARFAQFPRALALRPKHLRTSAAEAFLLNPAAMRLQSRYAGIATPATVIAGAGDRIVSPQQSIRLAALLPSSRLHLIGDAGHMVHHTATGEVVSLCDWP